VTTEIQPFDFSGQQVRVVTDEQGEPWFVAADVARILGYSSTKDMTRRLDDEDKGGRSLPTPGGEQEHTIISEPGLYVAVLGSQVEGARSFKRWVTREVLPAIRRTGSYVAPMTDAQKALVLAREVLSLHETVAELTPKAEFADRLLTADGDLSVGDAAKALTRAGVKTGAGRLFALLASKKWIYRQQGDGRWRVYQAAIDGGWMSVLPASHYHPKTGVLVLDPPQPRVTPKGLKRLLGEHGADVSTSIDIIDTLTTAGAR
jgi:prophage antirepressor-like protein